MTQEGRQALSGYIFLIDGGAVSWSSRKQELVSLSTAEAEYITLTHASKEALWIKQFITELFHPLDFPITLYSDNQGTIALAHAEQGQYHSCTKHIDIQYHFICQLILNGSITLINKNTNEMVADIFTKPLSGVKTVQFVNALGLLLD
jgi:hypothetical protein